LRRIDGLRLRRSDRRCQNGGDDGDSAATHILTVRPVHSPAFINGNRGEHSIALAAGQPQSDTDN
jgi:hypothetical protein